MYTRGNEAGITYKTQDRLVLRGFTVRDRSIVNVRDKGGGLQTRDINTTGKPAEKNRSNHNLFSHRDPEGKKMCEHTHARCRIRLG